MIEGLQQANISLDKGIVRTPSLGAEGELSECVNLIPRNGEMVRITEPVEVAAGFTPSAGEVLVAVHEVAEGTIYISRTSSGDIHYHIGGESGFLHNGYKASTVTVFGNVLVLTSPGGVAYYMWGKGKYTAVAAEQLRPKFGAFLIQEYGAPSDLTQASGSWIKDGRSVSNLYGNWISDSYTNSADRHTKVMGLANTLYRAIENDGHVHHPVYIRVATVMYDGSLGYLSPPIFLTPTSDLGADGVSWTISAEENNYETGVAVLAYSGCLAVKIDATALKGYRDLVRGIAVFCTRQYSLFDASAESNSFGKDMDEDAIVNERYVYPSGLMMNTGHLTSEEDGFTAWRPVWRSAMQPFSGTPGAEYPKYGSTMPKMHAEKRLFLPLLSDARRREELEEMANPIDYYQVAEIPFHFLEKNDFKVLYCSQARRTEETNFDLFSYSRRGNDDIYFGAIPLTTEVVVTQKALSSFRTPGKYTGCTLEGGTEFNSRYIGYGVTCRDPYTPYLSEFLPAFSSVDKNGAHYEISGYDYTLSARLTVDGDKGGPLASSGFSVLWKEGQRFYAAHHDYLPLSELKVFAQQGSEGEYNLNFPFTLQGSKASSILWEYAPIGTLQGEALQKASSPTTDSSISYKRYSKKFPGLVLVSPPGNPFTLTGEGAVELLQAEILAICPIATALSTGQFGEFPLLAFTNKGVWALTVADNGAISAKQPVSEEVIFSPSSVLQVDKGVVYATPSGLFLYKDGREEKISLPMEGPNCEGINGVEDVTGGESLVNQLKDAIFLYDRAHERLHMYVKPDEPEEPGEPEEPEEPGEPEEPEEPGEPGELTLATQGNAFTFKPTSGGAVLSEVDGYPFAFPTGATSTIRLSESVNIDSGTTCTMTSKGMEVAEGFSVMMMLPYGETPESYFKDTKEIPLSFESYDQVITKGAPYLVVFSSETPITLGVTALSRCSAYVGFSRVFPQEVLDTGELLEEHTAPSGFEQIITLDKAPLSDAVIKSAREIVAYTNWHWVWSIPDRQWAVQIDEEKPQAVVPGYPYGLLQKGDKLFRYEFAPDSEADTLRDGWLLTRPIAFGDPFVRKMLWDLRVMGQKTNPNTKWSVQVYISEDRIKWHRLTSLKGRSAKWYRFLIKASLTGLDTLSGIACQYVPRLGSKLR